MEVEKKNFSKNLIKKIFLFLILFTIFSLYHIYYTKVVSHILLNVTSIILILTVFALSIYKTKYSLYLFIFFIPLLNSFTTILEVRSVQIILFLFFPLFLGFLVKKYGDGLGSEVDKSKPVFRFEYDIKRAVVIFILIVGISSVVTIFRYANFYPFITNRYYDLVVNINGTRSTGSIFWTIRFFFNYIIGFLLLFVIFNTFKKIKDIIGAIFILLASTLISSAVGLYQFFFNPYFGNIRLWVNMNRFNATFTDPNSLGAYTLLLFPVFLSLFLFLKKWYFKLAIAVITIPFLVNMFLSGSRSAFLGLCVSLFIFVIIGIFWVFRKISLNKKNIKVFFRSKKAVILIITIFVFIIFLVLITYKINVEVKDDGTFIFTDNVLIKRVSSTFRSFINLLEDGRGIFKAISVTAGRDLLWSQAIDMFKDYPISGVGLGAYIIELPNYYVKNGINSNLVDYTGNYYLQILSELGIAGLAVVLFIFYVIIKKVFIYFKGREFINGLSGSNWLVVGFFTSFISMLIAQFFGPHTNFTEIQFTFWLIIGFMLTYINIKMNGNEKDSCYNNLDCREVVNKKQALKTKKKEKSEILKPGRGFGFDFTKKISLAVVLLIFTVSFFTSSFTGLSINVKQNLYGWENKYGFYKEETINDETFRWASVDASEVIEKRGTKLVVSIKDVDPAGHLLPLFIRFFIDNKLVKVVKINDKQWHDIEIDLSRYSKENLTFTLSCSRSWIPKERGLSNDTRELGVMVGEFEFLK